MRTEAAIKSEFHTTLEAMRAHHLGRTGGDFGVAFPQFLSMVALDAAPADVSQASVPEVLQPIAKALASQQQGVADAVSSGVYAAANDLTTTKDASSFQARMQAERQKALDASDANINAAFDKALKMGENADPVTQNVILAGMNVVQGIVSKVTSLICDMVGKVLSMIGGVLEELMSKVTGALEGFAGDVGDALGGLF
jgi:hypothetical protein